MIDSIATCIADLENSLLHDDSKEIRPAVTAITGRLKALAAIPAQTVTPPPLTDDEIDSVIYGPKALLNREDWDAVTRKPKVKPATPAPVGGALDAERAALRNMDRISMKFAADLAQMHTNTIKGCDYLQREAVMECVVQWRREWDANSAARPAVNRAQQAGAGQAVAVPVGWKLVPIEPTKEMMDAAEKLDIEWPRTNWAAVMRVMTAAAPPAPAQMAESLDAARELGKQEGIQYMLSKGKS